MRILLSVLLLAAFAGCGGSRHYDDSSSDDDWSSTSSSGSSATTTSTGTDAGLDAATSADPVRDRAMALFARSCTPCHRHVAPVDGDAVTRGVFLETEAEILQLAHSYAAGNTPSGLGSIIGQRAEGYELMVGEDGRSPMPPRGSSYPPLTQEEARQIQEWFRAH